jgi:hypothetical protein
LREHALAGWCALAPGFREMTIEQRNAAESHYERLEVHIVIYGRLISFNQQNDGINRCSHYFSLARGILASWHDYNPCRRLLSRRLTYPRSA